MTDRLFFSLWLRTGSTDSPLVRLSRVLERFPFSRLAPRMSLAVRALSTREAPLFEDSFTAGDLAALSEAASAWTAPDDAFEVDASWDLLLQDGGSWGLRPARVAIFVYGPGFEREEDEDIRIEFGSETPFFPTPESPASFRFVQENIRSLLRLVQDLEEAFPVARRTLWSESGENFAKRLAGLAKP